MGFEYGATTRMDVVRGAPAHIDKPKWDMSPWIRAMNRLKLKIPVLSEEGSWRALGDFDTPFLFLEKASDRGGRSVYLCVNKNDNGGTVVDSDEVPLEVRHCSTTVQIMGEPMVHENEIPAAFLLEAAEIVLFM